MRSMLLVLVVMVLPVQACTITVAYNEVAAPPHYVGDGGKIPAQPGAAVELVNMAAASLGCHIQWRRMPIKRILRDLELNAIHATIALSFSKVRAQSFAYPMAKNGLPDEALAVWTSSYDFYVKRGSTLRWDGQQFNRKPQGVGANAGFSVVQDLQRIGITAEVAPADVNNFGKLVTGRIEVFAGQDLTDAQLRAQPEFHRIKKLTPAFAHKPYYLVFSKEYYAHSPHTAQALWRKIAQTKRLHGRALEEKYTAP